MKNENKTPKGEHFKCEKCGGFQIKIALTLQELGKRDPTQVIHPCAYEMVIGMMGVGFCGDCKADRRVLHVANRWGC